MQRKWNHIPSTLALIALSSISVVACVSSKPLIKFNGSDHVTVANGEKRAILKRVGGDYPAELQKRGITGVVIVRFTVEPDGLVSSATAVESPHAELSRLAEASIKQWVFAPASNGLPAEFRMPVTFSIK